MSGDATLLPGQPGDDGEPVFAEPWQAQAFAMAVRLSEAGVFSWREWADALAAEITRAQHQGDPDLGDTYYVHWVNALEKLVAGKQLASGAELAETRERWRHAFEVTPHGRPVRID